MRIAGLVCALLCNAMLVGCGSGGPDPVPVSGKVLYQGKPVADATVTFLSTSGGRSASGKTAADGTFTLTTNKTGDGAVPGDYIVTISKVAAKGASAGPINIENGEYGEDYGRMMDAVATGDMSKFLKDELPAKYGDPAQSGLRRTVTAEGPNEFEFNLE
ncbi:MAG: hypothetical protein KatS3mg111_3645 [Pirellulaceae bacterium]|nr:MAG: hypothetical protein KatS3mg111_3645 [Pirellulaceae bacterium]